MCYNINMNTRFGENAEKKTIPDKFVWHLEGVVPCDSPDKNKIPFDVKLALFVLVVFLFIVL